MDGPPRIIHSLWLQGRAAAPPLVQLNWESWETLNPGYRLNILEASDLDDLLCDFPDTWRALPPQALSDIVRIVLLARSGGIWTDASVLPARPLESWLPEAMQESDFFAYAIQSQARPLSSWFLASRPGSNIIDKWHAATRAYWAHEHAPLDGDDRYFIPEDPSEFMGLGNDIPRREYPYFWFHHLFGHLVRTDPQFAVLWDGCCRKSADDPHRLQEYFRANERKLRPVLHPTHPGQALMQMPQRRKRIREIARILASSEMHKLDWRADYPIGILRTLLRQRLSR